MICGCSSVHVRYVLTAVAYGDFHLLQSGAT